MVGTTDNFDSKIPFVYNGMNVLTKNVIIKYVIHNVFFHLSYVTYLCIF